jgi:hypothetical protein
MTQFKAIFVRNTMYLLRNPRSLNGILFSGSFAALLNLSLYYKVGDWSQVDPNDPAQTSRYINNIKGFAFLTANNISFSSSSSVILQMPLQIPVFKREYAN